MKRNWLKYLNPFYFDERVVLSAIWLNLLLSVLLLAVAGITVFKVAPMFVALSSRMAISPTRLDQDWNVIKLRKMVVEEFSSDQEQIRNLAKALDALALASGAIAVFLFLNAYYFYRARRPLNESTEKKENGFSP